MLNSTVLSIISAVLFFVVAHPLLFKLVERIIKSLFGITQIEENLLVIIHSVVFGLLMFGSINLLLVIAPQFESGDGGLQAESGTWIGGAGRQ